MNKKEIRQIASNYYKELKKKNKTFVIKNLVNSKTKGEDAISSMVFSLSSSMLIHQIDFDEFENDRDNNDILDISFMSEPGPHFWKEYIKKEYVDFADELFKITGAGVGTPRAAIGCGEFMASVLSPLCKKSKRGDIELMNSSLIIEFKNNVPCATSNKKGSIFRQDTVKLAKSYDMEPLYIEYKSGGKYTVELTENGSKNKKRDYWDNELNKLSKQNAILFIKKWLLLTGAFDETTAKKSAMKSYKNGRLDRKILINEIIIEFFHFNPPVGDFLVMFADNIAVTVEINAKSFRELFDKGMLKEGKSGNYFRLNQNVDIGWYYTFDLEKMELIYGNLQR